MEKDRLSIITLAAATAKSKYYYEQTLMLAGGIDSFKYVKNVVRAGKGPQAYPVGTQFRVGKENSMTATLGNHTGITAVSVNEESFLAAEGIVGSGIHEFEFDGAAWHYEGNAVRLADYGITVTGTPAAGDQVVITEAFSVILFDVVHHRVTGENIAEYSASSTYAQGDICVQGGFEWLCNTTISTAEAWNAAHWTRMMPIGKPVMYLMMHHTIYGRVVDNSEALIYTAEGLPAGSYCITVANQAWYTEDNGKTFYFTLANDVPAGSQLKANNSYNATMEGATLNVYAKGETTVLQSCTLSSTEIAGATNLGTSDGTGNVHFMHCVVLGNNDYEDSGIRQWLNSGNAANAWWVPKHDFDRPVNYTNVAGFMHGMDADFLDAVQPIPVPCKRNNTWVRAGRTKNSAYVLEDKFWLASRDEMGYGEENVAEGSVFDLYNGASNEDRIKYDLSAQTSARYWFLRSPNPGYAYTCRYVNPSGALNYSDADDDHGAVAACAIW